MHDMDLIPTDYRQRRQQQRRRRWWLLLLGAALLCITGARWGLIRLKTQEQAGLQALAPQRDRVKAERTELQGLQAQIKQLQDLAVQQTQTTVPWQRLPPLLAHLPDGLWLEQLRLSRPEPTAGAASSPQMEEAALAVVVLNGQARNHDTLSRALSLWRNHAEVRGLELLNARPRSNPTGDTVEFQLRLHLPAIPGPAAAASSSAASAAQEAS